MPQASLKDVAAYLRKPGETLKEFTEEWKSLSDTDKDDFKNGIGDGTFTY